MPVAPVRLSGSLELLPENHSANKPLILCVDDEPHVREAIKRVLHRYGCNVLCARNGEHALSLLESHPVEVIICDEVMPGMRGTEVLRRAKVLSPRSTRVMLTGHCNDPVVVTRAVYNGEIRRLVAKPWVEQDIKRVVADALGAPPTTWSPHHGARRQKSEVAIVA